jgi:hypothetical protein
MECALGKAEEQQRGYAAGNYPTLAKSLAAGHRAGVEMRERKGPAYDRWVASLINALSTPTTIEPSEGDTVTG